MQRAMAFQVSSEPKVTAITAGVAASQLVGGNPDRGVLYVQNLHATAKIYIVPQSAGIVPVAGLTGCILILPGGSFTAPAVTRGSWLVISDTAATPVSVYEF